MTQIAKQEDLDTVFLPRKKVGIYHKIEKNYVTILEEVFLKRPYPSKAEIQSLAQMIQQTEIKVRNWFKSQRKKDFLTHQKIIKNYKRNHSFNREQREVLEAAFRQSSELTFAKLTELQTVLNCSPNLIKQWYYYRHRKLRKTLSVKDKKEYHKTNLDLELDFACKQMESGHKPDSHLKSQMNTMASSNNSSLSYPIKDTIRSKRHECSDRDKDSSNQNEEVFNSSNSNSHSGKERNEEPSNQTKTEPRPSQKLENPMGKPFLPVTNLIFAPISQNTFSQGYQPNMNLLLGNNAMINKIGVTQVLPINNPGVRQNGGGFNSMPVLNLLLNNSGMQQQQQQACFGFLPNTMQMMTPQINPMILNKGNVVANGNNLYLLMPLNINKTGGNIQKD